MNSMFKTLNELNQCHTSSAWRKLSEEGLFCTKMKLVQIMFVILVQTAVVECKFSMHRILKVRLRNWLRILTVETSQRMKMLRSVGGLDVHAAAGKYAAIPKEDSRSGLLLNDLHRNDLHRKVSQVRIGLA